MHYERNNERNWAQLSAIVLILRSIALITYFYLDLDEKCDKFCSPIRTIFERNLSAIYFNAKFLSAIERNLCDWAQLSAIERNFSRIALILRSERKLSAIERKLSAIERNWAQLSANERKILRSIALALRLRSGAQAERNWAQLSAIERNMSAILALR